MGIDDDEQQRLVRRGLNALRCNGFAINNQGVETGLSAVGMAVVGGTGIFAVGIPFAIPTVRFNRD